MSLEECFLKIDEVYSLLFQASVESVRYETDHGNNLMPSTNSPTPRKSNSNLPSESKNCVLSCSNFQRQGEEDRSGGKMHLPDGPPHPQHQGCPIYTGHRAFRL